MRRLLLIIITSLVLASAATGASPKRRTSKDVKRDRQKTEQQIKKTRQQIAENDRATARQLDRLSAIKADIELRNDTIARVQRQLDAIDRRIAGVTDSIAVLSRRDSVLKVHYINTLRTLRDRRRGVTDLKFIFSANSFAQAWRRMRYLRELAAGAKTQAERLRAATTQLADARARLDTLRRSHADVLAALSASRTALQADHAAADRVVADLRKQGKSLGRELERRRKQARSLEAELDRIVEQEIREAEERRRREEAALKAKREKEAREKAERERLAREKAEREKAEQEKAAREKAEKERIEKENAKKSDKNQQKDKPKPPVSEKPKQQSTPATPPVPPAADQPKQTAPQTKPAPKPQYESEAEADRRLTGSFVSNKGRLLFPVAGKYTVIGKFGTYEHPELSKVKVDNLGIDILVPPGAKARAVFEGTVSSIFRLDGYQNIVILRHGQYLTVYAGIGSLAVKKGDKVKAGQTLGSIYTEPDDNRAVLHFEIRLEKQKLNPSEWVR